MDQEGFWYDVGRLSYKCFEILEWMYDNISPNKIIIAAGFVAVASWVYVQYKYNQKAKREGTLQ